MCLCVWIARICVTLSRRAESVSAAVIAGFPHTLIRRYCVDSVVKERDREKMGCDGGSIPKRVEMVKLKKKDEKVSARSCALTVGHGDTASNRGQLRPMKLSAINHIVSYV